jgi:outer membrane protein OmpA-like peptidoglycan-associated protein
MRCRGGLRCIQVFGLISLVGFLTAGCATLQGEQDPPALPAIEQANSAIQAAKQAGAEERFPEDYAALETRYLETRGVFYACKDDQALEMANALVADANALATRRVEVAPTNMAPTAQLAAIDEAFVNTPVEFDASGTSDPDTDELTYNWSFGDGTNIVTSTPITTHTYVQVGNYTARVRVEDGRGGIDEADTFVRIVSREQIRSDVLFEFDEATLRPGAEAVLSGIVEQLQANPSYQVELIGHTDATGPEEYNMGLSERRAKAVQAYLEEQGIEPQRITADWKGESAPEAPNDTKEGRAQNRRTEIIVNPQPVMQ